MYKLLIVDDEAVIRNGMARSVPWQRLGFEVVGLYENGLRALEHVRRLPPDVVLADIRMPEMDGLGLMQALNLEFPAVKIVILSGYSDFEYVKASLKSRAVDYLLKPSDMDELCAVFTRIKETLDGERREGEALSALKQQSAQAESMQLAGRLEMALRGEAGADTAEQATKAGLYLDNCYVLALLPEAGGYGQLSDLADRGNGLLMAHTLFFVTHEETLLCLHCAPTEESLSAQAAQALAETLAGLMALRAVGISRLCTETDMLPIAYEQALCAVRQRAFHAGGVVAHYRPPEEASRHRLRYLNMQEVEPALLSGDGKALTQSLEDLFAQFEAPGAAYEWADYVAMEAMLGLSRWAVEYDVDTAAVLKALNMQVNDVFNCPALQAKKALVLRLFMALQREVASGRGQKSGSSIAARLRKCVDENFTDNAVSLEFVAQKLGKSPVYISKVFKYELGCNFSAYLTRKRMQRAEQLLRDPALKVYEIAQSVGYVNPSNFIKVFRKHKGISPNAFRDLVDR